MRDRLWRFILTALVVMAAAAMAAPGHAARRVALVVGNSSYKFAPQLGNPKNDATDMAAALRARGFEVIEGVDLDKAGFDNKIRDFANVLSGADVATFFYAGHGLQVGGQNYLVPIDAQLTSAAALDFEMVRLDLVQRTMEREAQTNVIFLDACRNNPLARNLARAMGTRSADIGRGLAAMESGVGTLISFSTQPGNVALDGSGRNSPFAGALVKQISVSNEDLGSVLIAVRNDVMQATQRQQVPWEHSALTGRVYFGAAPAAAPAGGGSAAPAGPSMAPMSEAATAWGSVNGLKDQRVLEAFVRQFPGTVYAELARQQIEALKPKVASVAPPPAPPPVPNPAPVSAPTMSATGSVAASLPSSCKGLEKSGCEANTNCQWIEPRSISGGTPAPRPYCRGKLGVRAESAAAPAPSAPAPSTAWVKICEPTGSPGIQPVCATHHERLAEQGGALIIAASISETDAGGVRQLKIKFPLVANVAIQPGLRARVVPGDVWDRMQKGEKLDDSAYPTLNPSFDRCDASGCQAQTELSAQIVEQFKPGHVLVVLLLNGAAATYSYPIPLDGLSAALSGSPFDKAKYEQARSTLFGKLGSPVAPLALLEGSAGAGIAPAKLSEQVRNPKIITPWSKVCETVQFKDAAGQTTSTLVCLTLVEVLSGSGPTNESSVAVRIVDGSPTIKRLMVRLPPAGQRVGPGVSVSLHKADAWSRFEREDLTGLKAGTKVELKYTTCNPTGCIAEADATPEILAELEAARGLVASTVATNGGYALFAFPLAGYAKAHAGPAMDNAKFSSDRQAALAKAGAGAK